MFPVPWSMEPEMRRRVRAIVLVVPYQDLVLRTLHEDGATPYRRGNEAASKNNGADWSYDGGREHKCSIAYPSSGVQSSLTLNLQPFLLS